MENDDLLGEEGGSAQLQQIIHFRDLMPHLPPQYKEATRISLLSEIEIQKMRIRDLIGAQARGEYIVQRVEKGGKMRAYKLTSITRRVRASIATQRKN